MIKTEQVYLKIEAETHPGVTGKQNEDRYGVATFLTGSESEIPSVVAVLCDGIGGHRAGEIAAAMGVSVIMETLGASDSLQPLEIMTGAIHRANQTIYQASQAEEGRAGMGATCAVAWVIGSRLYTANLGDSRIYLLRDGHIIQLTTDHTWIQEALDAGIISPEDGEEHPNAHVIRRYLGAKRPPQPDFRLWYFEGEGDAEALDNQGLQLQPGDIVLLCSDGLTDLMTDEEIRKVILSNPLGEVPARLIETVNNRGGHDNTTLILLEYPREKRKMLTVRPKRRWLAGCLMALAVISLLIVAVLLKTRSRDNDGLDQEGQPVPTFNEIFPTATAALQRTSTSLPSDIPTSSPDALTEGANSGPTMTPWHTDTGVP